MAMTAQSTTATPPPPTGTSSTTAPSSSSSSRPPREKRGNRSRSNSSGSAGSGGSRSPTGRSQSSAAASSSTTKPSKGGGSGSLLNPIRFRSWSSNDKNNKNVSPTRPTRTKSNDSNDGSLGNGSNHSRGGGGGGGGLDSGSNHSRSGGVGIVSSVIAKVKRTASGSLTPMRSKSNAQPKRQVSKAHAQANQQSRSSNGSSNGSSNKSKKKGVQFDSKSNQIYKVVPRLSGITLEEKNELWFTKDEFNLMYDDCDKTIERLEQGKTLKDKKYTSHGLESWTNEGHYLRKYDKEDAWDAVLDQQKHTKRKYGRRISTNVSLAYQQVSKDAKQRAIDIAKSNQDDVNNYILKDINEPRPNGTRSSLARLIDTTEFNLENLIAQSDDDDDLALETANNTVSNSKQKKEKKKRDSNPRDLSIQDMNDLNELIRNDLRTQTRTGAFDDNHSSLNEINYFMDCLDAKDDEEKLRESDKSSSSSNSRNSGSMDSSEHSTGSKSGGRKKKTKKPKKNTSTTTKKPVFKRAQRRRSSF